MFIKLTRLDNRPVWLNASFIVTVEPRRDGNGAVVVPIGDGLDYDVRESPETVLGMVAGAPVPTVVPVPVSDCLTKTPADVSPVTEAKPAAPKSAETKPEAPKPAEKKPRKRTTRAKAKPADAKAEAKADETKPAPEPVKETPASEPPKVPKLELSPDQVARLAKLAPKSIAKLKNTLATQFHVADIGGAVLALEAKGAFKLEGNRVLWPVPLADW